MVYIHVHICVVIFTRTGILAIIETCICIQLTILKATYDDKNCVTFLSAQIKDRGRLDTNPISVLPTFSNAEAGNNHTSNLTNDYTNRNNENK